MVQRRTRALAELVMSTISLPVCIYLWKLPSKYADEMEELDEIDPPRLSLPALAAGAIDGTIERWLSDRDVFQIRTNRWRGILFSFRGVVQGRLIKRYASDPNSSIESADGVGVSR